MANFGIGAYYPMADRVLGRNENADNGFGPYCWPAGVPNQLLGTAEYGDIRVTVRKELVPLFELMFEITDLMGYKIHVRNPNPLIKESWGPWSYENRKIGGSVASPSNHSRGRAIDVNSPWNPQSKSFVSTWPPEIINLWEQCGYRWGGRYKSPTKYDTMHLNYAGMFSEIGSDIARARSFRDRLRGNSTTKPVPVPSPAPSAPAADGNWPLPSDQFFGPSNASPSNNGTDNQAEKNFVAEFQDQLNKLGYSAGAPDGIFGAKTAAAARAWQQRVVATIDGAVNASAFRVVDSGLCGWNDWYAIHDDRYRVRPAAASYAPPYPGLLKIGSKGAGVQLMQGRLNEHLRVLGLRPIEADGDFGSNTQRAVRIYQQARHTAPYNLDVDGQVGPATWRSLWT